LKRNTYDHDAWLAQIKGFEHEPERGARCAKCFDFSLRRTAQMAKRLNIPEFTTTLTISPYKSSKMIFEVGSKYAGFSPIDFKKRNGFLRSSQISREMHLYRQSYCGCEFSMPLPTATA
jgi:hypothetical protein